jgi:hypothetical protein
LDFEINSLHIPPFLQPDAPPAEVRPKPLAAHFKKILYFGDKKSPWKPTRFPRQPNRPSIPP